MRWLGILAIMVAGAAIYLYATLSSGASAPTRREAKTAPVEETEKPQVSPPPIAKPATPPVRPSRPFEPAKPHTETTASPSPSSDRPAVDKLVDATTEEVPWTEQERQQWLWTANGRFEKGNYRGAIEASLEIARRNPGSAWEQDAWRVTIKSYCAMAEPEKANALFAKMTDPNGIDEVVKGCGEWNVPLTKAK